jgi:hypothetical protein
MGKLITAKPVAFILARTNKVVNWFLVAEEAVYLYINMYYFNVGSCITAMNTKNFKLAIKLIFIMGLFFRQAAADDYQRK